MGSGGGRLGVSAAVIDRSGTRFWSGSDGEESAWRESWDPLIRRDVAIKLLLDASPDAEFLERFHREATTVARLRHPNIVIVSRRRRGLTAVRSMAMEYIAGETLEPGFCGGRPPLLGSQNGLEPGGGLVRRCSRPRTRGSASFIATSSQRTS